MPRVDVCKSKNNPREDWLMKVMQVGICVCFLLVLSKFAINSLISLVPFIIYQLTFPQNHSRH